MPSINTYILPVKEQDLEKTSSDPSTHIGMDKFAIDFEVPEGSSVMAAADGEVIFSKVNSNEGGDDTKYEDFKFYNHIVIKHGNGEYTEYGHLRHNGAKRLIGDRVYRGDVIAVSGNTGYSEKPHLHFSVFRLNKMDPDFNTLPQGKGYFINDNDFGFETVEPRFV